mgnify:CR=1 FL=1
MKARTQTVKKGRDLTIEEVREAVQILSAQCGIPRIRDPNKKTILAFLDHHFPDPKNLYMKKMLQGHIDEH